MKSRINGSELARSLDQSVKVDWVDSLGVRFGNRLMRLGVCRSKSWPELLKSAFDFAVSILCNRRSIRYVSLSITPSSTSMVYDYFHSWILAEACCAA